MQNSSACVKIRYIFIETVGDEEEEYAAGGGIERGFIGWENLASCRGRSLWSWIAETALCFEPRSFRGRGKLGGTTEDCSFVLRDERALFFEGVILMPETENMIPKVYDPKLFESSSRSAPTTPTAACLP